MKHKCSNAFHVLLDGYNILKAHSFRLRDFLFSPGRDYPENKFYTLTPCTCIPKPFFDPICEEFIALYHTHYIMIQNLAKLSVMSEGTDFEKELKSILINLGSNNQEIINIIGRITSRKIEVYTVEKKDTLHNIAKKFNADLRELYELNGLKNIFSLNETQTLLVPILDGMHK